MSSSLQTSENLLEQIEYVSNEIKSNIKKTSTKKLDQLLNLLDDLIQLSADRFMSLGDIDRMDIEEDSYTPYIVHPDDIIKARNYSSFILLKLISFEYDHLIEDDNSRIERASRILAHMSGRGGKMERQKKKKFFFSLEPINFRYN